MKKTRLALLHSVIALLLCCSMLIGTTFAWFTDEVVSGNNIIRAGNLDIEMYWTDDLTTGTWYNAEKDGENTPFDYDLWEPGYTEVRYVKIVNAGSLALKYSLTLAPVGVVGKLAEVIDVFYAENVTVNIADRTLGGMKRMGLLKDTIRGGEAAKGELLPNNETIVAIAMHMDEEAGNIYQGESIGDGFTFKLIATQMAKESDSFGSDYDANAAFPASKINFSTSVPVAADSVENGALKQEMSVGDTAGDIYAKVPAGVKLVGNADSLPFNVKELDKGASQAKINLSDGETAMPIDVDMPNVAEDNDVPIQVTLKGLMRKGLNTTSVAMYHVENGVTVPMTLVANPTNHNEFSYDPATGDVVMSVTSFSEYVPVVDNLNPWEDGFDYSWYIGKSSPYTISTADQLAGFGMIVDGTAEGIEPDTFAGKIVKLDADIDLWGKDEEGNLISFNPIGCGYVNGTTNSKDANGNPITGRAFMGTFDGNGHTISNLYQNGWDIGLSYCTLGGGLFASVAGTDDNPAVIKNLTVSGADIRMECVEQGILVGLSQGTCTYENIRIYDSKVANYQRATGGLIGEVSWGTNGGGTTTISNVTIGSDVVVGSLWGDFDAPVGGVIGARWDNEGKNPQIVMQDVTVACRLDVYNDVTSAYQWYAYRRAGMLIGNTELVAADGRTASAPFLTCVEKEDGTNTVTVYYGGWNDYHYYKFDNQDEAYAWQNGYPWVRAEVGENNAAFSNPRYGHPVVNGIKITTRELAEVNKTGYESIPFNQLYGGGQGVYGAASHENSAGIADGNDVTIETYDYTVTFVDRGKVYHVEYCKISDTAYAPTTETTPTRTDYNAKFAGWVNAGGQPAEILANNKDNVIVYDSWDSVYTARYADQNGIVFFEEEFTGSGNLKGTTEIPDLGEDFVFTGTWDIYDPDNNRLAHEIELDSFKLSSINCDLTMFPIYKYSGDVKLIPIDETGDGDIEYYQVGGFGDGGAITVVEIPNAVNGIPVTMINAGAFKSFDDLYAAKIPANITSIGANAFTEQSGSNRDQVTLYYQGDPNDWKHAMDELYVTKPYSYYTDYNTAGTYTEAAKLKLDSSWDSGAGDGSRIFFLDTEGNVDLGAGYWELHNAGTKKDGSGWFDYGKIYVWVFHNHIYDNTATEYKNCVEADTHYKSFTDYDAADRPDKDYWLDENGNSVYSKN